jgi:hypothetical protein
MINIPCDGRSAGVQTDRPAQKPYTASCLLGLFVQVEDGRWSALAGQSVNARCSPSSSVEVKMADQ